VRGQIQDPATLIVASLSGCGVNPTAVEDTLLPCHSSGLQTERPTDEPTGEPIYMMLGNYFVWDSAN